MKLLTITDVCKRLNLSYPTVKRAINSGEIPTVKLGKRIYVTDDALEKLVNGL